MGNLQNFLCDYAKKNSFPQQITQTLLEFCGCYEVAIRESGYPEAETLKTFQLFFDTVVRQLTNPYQFELFHSAERSPIDFYKLGLDFVRPILNFSQSTLIGRTVLQGIEQALSHKENAILLANHQTEVDPQIISLLIEKEFPDLAEKMIFVAGHRVTSDPLAVPFSLGRNLLCIYSKRHIDTPPEKRAEKVLHNAKTMQKLEELLKEGGKCIYVAPSGGRDRRNQSGAIEVAPFDPQSIEMFNLIAQKSGQKTRFYPLSLSTYNLLPPPAVIVKDLGETRTCAFAPCHLAFMAEVHMDELAGEIADKKERRQARADRIYRSVSDQFMQFEQLAP